MKNKWALLGGLRFFLATVVASAHLNVLDDSHTVIHFLGQFGGLPSVLCFFVISGYSIRASIDREPDQFYARRFWRIYPTYFVVVALAAVPFIVYGPAFTALYLVEAPTSIWSYIGSFALLQGICVPVVNTDTALWSLSVECVYYLIAPFLKKPTNRGVLAIAMASALIYILDQFNVIPFLNGTLAKYPMYFWAWLVGWVYYNNRGKVLYDLLLFVPTTIIASIDKHDSGMFLGATMTITAAVLRFGPELELKKGVQNFLTFLGELSYPLYLVHLVVISLIAPSALNTEWGAHHHWLVAIICYACALLTSIVLYFGVDLPMRRYGKRRMQTIKAGSAQGKNVSVSL